jgi:WD40 repeat protein
MGSEYTSYLSWGHSDFSMRLATLDGDKTLSVVENVHNGQITCLCASESGRLLVSGGDDSVVSVYRMVEVRKQRRFYMLRNLCSHAGAITALAVSRACSLAVSGSEDRTCIVWDLNRLSFVRQLSGHESHVSAVRIHHLNGEIVTASGTSLRVWDVNGVLLLHRQCASASDPITSLELSHRNWWQPNTQLYITGHRSGLIRVWRRVDRTARSALELCSHLQLHSCAVTALYLSCDERLLLSADRAGRVIRTTV